VFRPKRAYLWLAGLALVVGAMLLTDRLLWQPGLSEQNLKRIRPGKTLAEVEALLGGPAPDAFEMPADYKANFLFTLSQYSSPAPSLDYAPGWAADRLWLITRLDTMYHKYVNPGSQIHTNS